MAAHTKLSDFISFLTTHGELRGHKFRSPRYSKEITRYSWGAVTPLQLAASIKPRGYFSHGTAAMLHGLIKPTSKTIYLNVEQSEKSANDGVLAQDAIDRAFANKQRQSNLVYACHDIAVTILSGKHANRLAVEEMIGPTSEKVRVTSLERTLIDIVVRPVYAGGISTVLDAYRAAKDRMSVDRLLSVLEKLDYVYPYHQAIGFLMEMAGHSEKNYAKLRELGLKHNFYLAHAVRGPEYSKEWRLFYPRDVIRT